MGAIPIIPSSQSPPLDLLTEFPKLGPVFDLEFISILDWVDELRPLTGADQKVRDSISRPEPSWTESLDRIESLPSSGFPATGPRAKIT